ncbi:MAG: NAD-dependent deacylase [Lewinellaceae bacterium]|nr:NAD-dependent deacylase [Lewinellaceae bacterium]
MKKLVVLTGAGISAESGIPTFRDAGGLWEGHRVEEVATPGAWARNPELVLQFYNERRRKLQEVEPNDGHRALVDLESKYQVTVVTQNVDDLHERAGSKNVIHLHGELLKARSSRFEHLVYHWPKDIRLGDFCERGAQLRPHIVWFGEMVPMMEEAARVTSLADILLIVGTSMQVYPAAGLAGYVDFNVPIYYIDPKPSINYELAHADTVRVIPDKASTGVRKIVEELLL